MGAKITRVFSIQLTCSLTEQSYCMFYFFFYAGYMPFLLYLPVCFKYIGLNPAYVGLLNGIRPILQSVGAPLLLILGKRLQARKLLFVISCLIMIAKALVIFLILRPRQHLCTIKYNNWSGRSVRDTSHFMQYKEMKRLQDIVDSDAMNETIKISRVTQEETLNSAKRNLREQHGRKYSASKKTTMRSFQEPRKRYETRLNRITMTDFSSYNMSRVTEAPHSDQVSYGISEYLVTNDQDEIFRIFVALLVLVLLGDWFDATVFTLVDDSCVAYLENDYYGFIRLWGTIGWGIMTPVVGILVNHFQHELCGRIVGSFHYVFFFFFGFFCLAMLVGLQLDFKSNSSDIIARNVRSAGSNFQYGIYLIASSYSGFCNGFFLTFINWFIDSLGGSAVIMGTASACKCLVDIMFFFLLGKVIESVGHQVAVNIGLLGHIGVFLIYYGLNQAWMVIIAETVHAVFYTLMTSTCISFLVSRAPTGSSQKMQAILQGIYWGLGTGFGSILGGYYLEHSNFAETFEVLTVITTVVAVVFLVAQMLSCLSGPREWLDEVSSQISYNIESDDEGSDCSQEFKDELFIRKNSMKSTRVRSGVSMNPFSRVFPSETNSPSVR